jgi:hypothetical protein
VKLWTERRLEMAPKRPRLKDQINSLLRFAGHAARQHPATAPQDPRASPRPPPPPRSRPLPPGPVLLLRSGPAPAEQCDPDELEHHDGLVLGAFSDDDDSGPEGGASAAAPARAKVLCRSLHPTHARCCRRPRVRAVWVPAQMHPRG